MMDTSTQDTSLTREGNTSVPQQLTGEKILYEYAILRYVADIERGEFVNIGLIMMCKRHRWLRAEINIDEKRIRAFFPKANLNLLTTQSGIFTSPDTPSRDLPVEERYRWLTAVKSAVLQTSPSHPGILIPEPDLPASHQLDSYFSTLFNRLV